MDRLSFWCAVAISAAFLLASLQALAQAPGEDPVLLKNRPQLQLQPAAPPPKSGNIDNTSGMPAWMRARVARYEARAFSADTTGLLTDNDVVASSNAQGLRKTCVQEVGSSTISTTAGGRPGVNQAQIVVLRGDLVNICN